MPELERFFGSKYLNNDFLDDYNEYFTRFLESIHQNNQECIDQLLSENGATSEKTNPWTQETVLHLAVRFGSISLISRIVELGTNINATDYLGQTPLHRAMERSAEIVQILLDNGADVEIADRLNVKPLQRSFISGSIETVYLLMKKKYFLESCSIQEKTPTNDFEKCSKIVKHCLDLKIDLNWKKYPTLVHFAAKYGDEETLKLALNKSENININSLVFKKQGLLHIIADAGRSNSLKIILEYGADVDRIDITECTPLYYALMQNDLSIVRLLLDYGADVNHENDSAMKPLSYALRYCTKDIVEMLVNSGADIHGICSICTICMPSTLHNACGLTLSMDHPFIHLYWNEYESSEYLSFEYWGGCSPEIIQILLQKGANVDAKSLDGMTPLFVACRNGRLDIVQILLEFGAYLHERALIHAVEGNNVNLVSFLIRKGANVNAKSSDEMTPLLIACKNGRFDMVQILLEFGADLHERALLYAIDGRNIKLVSFFIGIGYNVNAHFVMKSTQNRHKEVTTPFHRIFDIYDRNLNVELIEILADNGAFIGGPYPDGNNIILKAIHNQKPEELVCLLELKASVEVPIEAIDISPYSEICCAHSMYQKNPGKSITLQQFTAFLALKEEDILLYVRNEVENADQSDFHNSPTLNHFDDAIFLYHVEFYRKCRLETEKLKSTDICNGRIVSYFDLLSKELLVVAPLTRSEELMQVLDSEEYKTEFPYYSFLLEQRIGRVKKLRTYVDMIEEFIEKEYAKRSLPWVVFRKIFSFWNVGDVRNFGRALSLNEK